MQFMSHGFYSDRLVLTFRDIFKLLLGITIKEGALIVGRRKRSVQGVFDNSKSKVS